MKNNWLTKFKKLKTGQSNNLCIWTVKSCIFQDFKERHLVFQSKE